MRTAPDVTAAPRKRRPTPWLLGMWRSQLGKKYAMAISGLVIYVWLFFHMVGNLKLYMGPEAMDEYAVWLRIFGAPAAPAGGLLWVTRVILLGAFVVHIVAALQLWRLARKARSHGYRTVRYTAADYAGRTMRWGGVILALFVVYHLMHLTWGNAHPDFVHGAVWHNVVTGLQRWPVSAVYIVANVALGFHIYHGIWSMFQTMGWNNRRFNHWRRYLAVGSAVVIAGGNISFPVAVLTGFIG